MEVVPLKFPLWAKIATVAILAVLFLALLRSMGSLLSPFAWAIVVSYLLTPLVRLLTAGTPVRRFWWVLLIYVVAGFLIVTAVNTLGPLLGTQFNELRIALPGIAQRTSNWIQQNGTLQIGAFTLNLRPAEADLVKWLTDIATSVPRSVPKFVFGVVETLILWLVFLVVTFYLLLQGDTIIEWLYQLVPPGERDEIRELGRSIDRVLGAYIRSQLFLIFVMAFVTWVALSIAGVQYALILGIMTGFLEVIPFVGPYSAAGIAIFAALVQTPTPFGWPNWVLGLVVAGIYLVLRQAEDHLIIPNLVGHIVRLHPIIVIFSVLAGGHLGGPLGLFIAIPLAATIRIILAYLYMKLIDNPAPLLNVHAQETDMLGPEGAAASDAPHSPAPQRRRGDLHDEPSPR